MLARTVRILLANWLFRLAATAALLAIVVWRSDPQRVASSFGKLGAADILIALALTLPFLYLKSLRWQLMLRNAGTDVSFADAAISLVGGMGLALVTPARLGEIARVAFLPDSRKLRLSALVLLDKMFDVLVLVLLAVAGAWVLLGPWVGILLGLLGVAGLVFVYCPQLFEPAVRSVEKRMPLGGKTKEAMSSLESLGPWATTSYILLTLAAFVVVIVQFAVILHGPEPHLNPRAAALTFPLVILTNVVPLTIAGLGIREGASVLLLGYYHVPAAIAGVAAFMMFFVNTAVPGIVGALLPAFRRVRRSETDAADTTSAETTPAETVLRPR